jgi:hypothetical protein
VAVARQSDPPRPVTRFGGLHSQGRLPATRHVYTGQRSSGPLRGVDVAATRSGTGDTHHGRYSAAPDGEVWDRPDMVHALPSRDVGTRTDHGEIVRYAPRGSSRQSWILSLISRTPG